jgi:hypothetical protein
MVQQESDNVCARDFEAAFAHVLGTFFHALD